MSLQANDTFPYSDQPYSDFYPSVPYNEPLPFPLQPLTMIFISGMVPEGADRFAVNLLVGMSSVPDIALHFNPRIDQRLVVRNSRRNVKWGQEERNPPIQPFRPGNNFEIAILCTETCYKIAANGRHFTDFVHRMPYLEVTHLQIEGDVHLYSIEIFTPGRYMTKHPHGKASPGPLLTPDLNPQPLQNPQVPFRYPLPNGLAPNTTLWISGYPAAKTFKRFGIDFECPGEGSIALHINPRHDQQCVVINSREGNHWGTEVRIPLEPHFKPGVYFDLSIHAGQDGFESSANGIKLFTFPHRLLPLSRITSVYVYGDVVVSGMSLHL